MKAVYTLIALLSVASVTASPVPHISRRADASSGAALTVHARTEQVVEPPAVPKDDKAAADAMEAMHVAQAEAKEKAHQEGERFMPFQYKGLIINIHQAAAKMEAEHAAKAEAEAKAHQEGD